jgi:hypothetical protein
VAHEQGVLAPTRAPSAVDQVRHAIKKTISGPAALCGAGRIEIRILGAFDSEADNACRLCAEILARH